MKTKNKKKFLSFLILGFIAALISLVICLNEFQVFTRLDTLLHDAYFRAWVKMQPKIKGDERIVIVDIDEKSLAKLGQWPWDRDILACLTRKLEHSKVVGFDIYFAEEDKRSIITRDLSDKEFAKLKLPQYDFCKRQKDGDAAFAAALSHTPSVLAFAFNLGSYENVGEKSSAPLSNINVAYEDIDINLIEKGDDIIKSIDILSDAAYASGFVNSQTYLDNVIRNVFMFIYYDDGQFAEMLPSLTLAMYAKYINSDNLLFYTDHAGHTYVNAGGVNFKLDSHALMSLLYKGNSPHYEYISAIDVLDGTVDPAYFHGKLVLIGTSVLGLNDIRSNRLDENLPGVEIHANILDNLLNYEYISKPTNLREITLLTMLFVIISSVIFLLQKNFFMQIFWHLIMLIAVILGHFLLLTEFKIMLDSIEIIFIISFMQIFGLIINYFLEKRQRELIREKFDKKVSKNVADELLMSDKKFKSDSREISVFFSDIRDFTKISEQMNAQELVTFLNSYMTPMSNIIFEECGTVDKYIGDAIMAYFNAPNDIEFHADAALRAAIEQIKTLKNINYEFSKKNLPYINIGIGINTSECVVGEMGSELRSDYTCIGDGVNVASRIEGLCKEYKANILLSENTFNALKDANVYEIKFVDEVLLKGKSKKIKIYRCDGFRGECVKLYH